MPKVFGVSNNAVNASANATAAATNVLYTERQWVPWYWWAAVAGLTVLLAGEMALNRNMWWFFGALIVVGALAAWFLVWLSRNTVTVEQDPDGTRWLLTSDANLPNTVVDRAMVVPASARQNALGRQLDPAAFLVTRSWVPEHVLLVLDDPEDPTPYWLISAKNPEAVLDAFVPGLND
ncbi:DUF3093 domain-containing protein [Corynebacterium lujinxingii]|uniref:DUF3093 domain-containing protein n=1 Tax=Corynebacterium lujinxingii TaxID=2763010 RepID=A0A7H0JWH7_9CORY|nr:DUF3093 domain-containing protein [Corynebacterium lujinxingii]NNO11176.1 DUF3093 family protein [Corynebacterium lujinxingii]QNP89393.1 DUF3093 domain-containing protein [Corynebacterium lujinxingii]